MRRIFFNGCSFTENCGFDDSNLSKYHWPWLISQHYQTYFYNAAIGGSSNDEIFYRAIKNCHLTNYDLVIIMWSSLSRKWIYFSDNNVDDFTIINSGGLTGFRSEEKCVSDYSRLYYKYFNNQYVSLQKWLGQIITLTSFFKERQQPYLYLKGFDNQLNDIDQITFDPLSGFDNMSNVCHQMLDFDNRPDYYINLKLNDLKSMINQIKTFNWVDFDRPGFFEQAQDLADDDLHPGPLSNQRITERIIYHCDRHNLL